MGSLRIEVGPEKADQKSDPFGWVPAMLRVCLWLIWTFCLVSGLVSPFNHPEPDKPAPTGQSGAVLFLTFTVATGALAILSRD